MARPPSSLPPTSPDSTLGVSLVVGSFVHKPLTVNFFDLIIPASQPVAPHPEEVHYHPRPAIEHTFRPGQKTPPAFISAVFSALVLAPWIVLVGLVCSLPLAQSPCQLTLWSCAVVATFSQSPTLVLPKDISIYLHSRGFRITVVLVLGRLEVGSGPTLRRRAGNCCCTHGQDRVGTSWKTKEEFDLIFITMLGTSVPLIDPKVSNQEKT